MTEHNAAHRDSVIMSSHLASALERGRGYMIVLVRTCAGGSMPAARTTASERWLETSHSPQAEDTPTGHAAAPTVQVLACSFLTDGRWFEASFRGFTALR